MILPGILLNYTIKCDKHYNLVYFTYSVINIVMILLGSIVWTLFCLFDKHAFPFSAFVYPTSVIGIYLLAYYRGEHKDIFQGNIYDREKEIENL